eukprot:TRINITY_DN17605_c0_g1_i4.p1 TRINITY_DN17605_c0_g1~~TRINITY_DN17605_c0_g1_i4.p1  ORF type:complete len:384 (+),score=84.89 TRINITY_DN17605_c0_g1_i4:124-1275(+)
MPSHAAADVRSAWKELPRWIQLLALMLAAFSLLKLLSLLIGLWGLLEILAMVLLGVVLCMDQLLAYLACFAIAKTPKAFRWEIEKICVRPSFSSEPEAWSTITIKNWTWLNPLEFDRLADNSPTHRPPQDNFLLKIEELHLKLSLLSIRDAFRFRKSVIVPEMRISGLLFRTSRNKQGALNLWEALQLHDNDVNISTLLQNEMSEEGDGDSPEAVVAGQEMALQPLPAVSTEATRQNAKYWRQEWGDRAAYEAQRAQVNNKEAKEPLLPDGSVYFEYPIGDKRRRPRWGVPLRFDIGKVQLLNSKLWVLDLLTLDSHKKSHSQDDKTALNVTKLIISRNRLESGDKRRQGLADMDAPADGRYRRSAASPGARLPTDVEDNVIF